MIASDFKQIVNIGVFAAIGRTFYTQPELRQNFIAISSAVATSIALLSVEGYIAGSYRKTLCGQEGKGSRGKGASIYRRLEQITRPQALGVLAGISSSPRILPDSGIYSSLSFSECRHIGGRWIPCIHQLEGKMGLACGLCHFYRIAHSSRRRGVRKSIEICEICF